MELKRVTERKRREGWKLLKYWYEKNGEDKVGRQNKERISVERGLGKKGQTLKTIMVRLAWELDENNDECYWRNC